MSSLPGIVAPLRQRLAHVWQRDEHDHYVEPAWCSERLFELSIFRPGMTIVDPSCGFGTIVESARSAGFPAYGFDIVPRWEQIGRDPEGYDVSDFLRVGWIGGPHAIVSNPPFKDAQRYAELALQRASEVVALLLPTKWVQGAKRSRWLASTPLYRVLCLCPRPSMPPGHVIAAGGTPGNGTVDFSWFIWRHGHGGDPTIGWLHRDTFGSSSGRPAPAVPPATAGNLVVSS